MLSEYGITQESMVLDCDNMSTINISKNPVQHSRTKHIDIHHYFIRELVETKVISLEHVCNPVQLADILTKPLDASIFRAYGLGLEFVNIVHSSYNVFIF